MKHLLLTTIAAVLVVGCVESQQSVPQTETKPESSTAKAPDISIHKAAGDGNIAVIKQHLAAGTDVNATDEFLGMTILHDAVLGGQKEIVEFLIAQDADVNATGRTYQTPLDTALEASRNKEIADLLRKHGGKTSEELKAEGK